MSKRKIFGMGMMVLTALTLSSCSNVSDFFGSIWNQINPEEEASSAEESPTATPNTTPDATNPAVATAEDFSIHFLELGNGYAGDCIYIKAGDVDILIDAGSRTNSISTIESYVDQYCTDKKLEYVIATHGDQDHIAGFADTSGNKGIFSYYEVGTIIDFKYTTKTTAAYKNYVSLRDKEVSQGATHYFADDLFGVNKLHKNVFELTDNIKMTILDQQYYHEKSSDENNHSVVTLFSVGENDHFLLTGDLEAEGEKSLVERNSSMPKVHLFKGGHHGSKTSSNDVLLDKIQPETCVVMCVAGANEYTGVTDNQFPTQAFINRIAKYTSKVYVTTQAEYEIATAEADSKGNSKITGVEVGGQYLKQTGYKSFNGTIVAKFVNGQFTIECSNDSTVLKDSEWFNASFSIDGKERTMRTWPANGVQ